MEKVVSIGTGNSPPDEVVREQEIEFNPQLNELDSELANNEEERTSSATLSEKKQGNPRKLGQNCCKGKREEKFEKEKENFPDKRIQYYDERNRRVKAREEEKRKAEEELEKRKQ